MQQGAAENKQERCYLDPVPALLICNFSFVLVFIHMSADKNGVHTMNYRTGCSQKQTGEMLPGSILVPLIRNFGFVFVFYVSRQLCKRVQPKANRRDVTWVTSKRNCSLSFHCLPVNPPHQPRSL